MATPAVVVGDNEEEDGATKSQPAASPSATIAPTASVANDAEGSDSKSGDDEVTVEEPQQQQQQETMVRLQSGDGAQFVVPVSMV